MQRSTFLLVAALATLSPLNPLLSVACSENSPNRENSGPTLQFLGPSVFLESYRDLDTSAKALDKAVSALRDDPTAATLAAAQTAWRETMKAWRRTDAFAFGPAVTKASAAGIDFWPANGNTIETTLAGTTTLDASAIAQLGANVKGLAALEYLLFDSTNGDASVLTALSGDAGVRRRTYAALIATLLETRTAELFNAWDAGGEKFTAEITNAGAGSKAYGSQKAAVDDIVNYMIFATESVVRARLAKPLGKEAAGVVQPALEESPRSDASLDDMQATLAGVESVYVGSHGGATGPGVSALVTARNVDLDNRVRAAIANAKAALTAVPPPMRTTLLGDKTTLEAAYEAVNALKRLLATEVASILGSALQFGDNDGD